MKKLFLYFQAVNWDISTRKPGMGIWNDTCLANQLSWPTNGVSSLDSQVLGPPSFLITRNYQKKHLSLPLPDHQAVSGDEIKKAYLKVTIQLQT